MIPSHTPVDAEKSSFFCFRRKKNKVQQNGREITVLPSASSSSSNTSRGISTAERTNSIQGKIKQTPIAQPRQPQVHSSIVAVGKTIKPDTAVVKVIDAIRSFAQKHNINIDISDFTEATTSYYGYSADFFDELLNDMQPLSTYEKIAHVIAYMETITYMALAEDLSKDVLSKKEYLAGADDRTLFFRVYRAKADGSYTKELLKKFSFVNKMAISPKDWFEKALREDSMEGTVPQASLESWEDFVDVLLEAKIKSWMGHMESVSREALRSAYDKHSA